MKKAIVLTLAAMMLLSCFISCVETPPASTTAATEAVTTAEETTPEETVDERYVADLPEEKFEGDFNILCEGSFWATTDAIFYEEASDNAELDAVWRRVDKIYEQFGAEIMVTPTADTTSALKNSVKSGDNSYDAVIARMPLIASSAANGDLMNLYEVDGLDLSKHYWDQSANAKLSIANKLFYTVGDIITTEDSATWTMMFNKKLAEALDLDDLYQVVKDGKWTFDYFYTVLKESGIAKPNDQGEWDHLATYAFATHMDMGYGFFYAAGLSFVQKDNDNLPFLDATNNEKVQKVLDYSLKVMRDNQLTIDAHKWVHVRAAAHELIAEAFMEDRALFFCEVLATIIGFRSMDTDFGILPLPKYDEAQTNYVTFVNPAASLVGVPIYQKNKDSGRRSGVILEAMAYYGHEYIVPAFIEKAIKGKSTRDVESIEMLDIIFQNRMYDLGLINDWGGLASGYNNLVFNNKNDYASLYKKSSKNAQKKLDAFLKKIVAD
jgi:hypothetical protein